MSAEWREGLDRLLAERTARAADPSKNRLRVARDWQAELDDHGLAAPGWPREVGGLGLELEEQLEYYRMVTAARAPAHPCPQSFIVAPTLIVHGTPWQRERFLRPLLRAEELWCQGFSEPEAGSDLASLRTRAVRDGDEYVVTGRKVWTSGADRADWMFALVRTTPLADGATRDVSGISYLLIPMDADGVTVRPLHDISGAAHFAEVLLDDVRVPVVNRVGGEGQGWSIMRTSLGHERATAFLADEFRYRHTVDRVVDLALARGLGADPLVRQDIARLESGVRIVARNSASALSAVLRGGDPGPAASVNRLVKAEFEQRLHVLALRATGPWALLGNRAEDAYDKGRWTYGYLMSRATTIGAGTAEIQRNTIAERVLGLPSHRDETVAPAAHPRTPVGAGEDERELRETLARALDRAVDPGPLLDPDRPIAATDEKLWSDLVSFGLPGLDVDTELGGAGADRRMLLAAVEECARATAAVPLVPTVTALAVLRAVDAPASVRRVCAGAAAAFVVPLDDDGWVCAGAELPEWDGAGLRGSVASVAGAPAAELLVVPARTAAGTPVLLEVESVAATVSAQQPLDRTATVATVVFDGTPGTVLGEGGVVTAALARARRVAMLAVAADAVGVAARALHTAVEWAGLRRQFDRPIGSFQAISHRLADMLVAVESARNLVLGAAEADDDDPDAALAVDLATAAALDAAVEAAEGCIQVHGGVGFTWEHPAHLLLRRALADGVVVGRPDRLRERAAQAVLSARETGAAKPSKC